MKNKDKKKNHQVVKAAMTVPHTHNSELAKRYREAEYKMEDLSGSWLKMVEKTGIKIQDLLTCSNPWSGQDCLRLRCWPCRSKEMTGKGKSQECSRRSLCYETWCLKCEAVEKEKIENDDSLSENEKKNRIGKIKLHKYIGETARSVFERGFEHENDLENLRKDSHMLKHVLDMHEEDNEKIEFGIRVIKFTRSSFERQILESCLIQEQRKYHHILNSKAEYNRCAVPRLMTKIGEKEFEKYGKEKMEEIKKEEIIEGKITKLRKARNARRKETPKNLANKRRKLDRDTYIENLERWGRPEMTLPKKRSGKEVEADQIEGGQPLRKRFKQTICSGES